MGNEKEIRCEACGCAFVPEVLTERDGDIEYTFFRCAYCGKAYMVSVTNGSLRDSIRRYIAMAERNREKRLPEEEQFQMQRLKEENVRMEAEIRRLCLKEDADDGE